MMKYLATQQHAFDPDEIHHLASTEQSKGQIRESVLNEPRNDSPFIGRAVHVRLLDLLEHLDPAAIRPDRAAVVLAVPLDPPHQVELQVARVEDFGPRQAGRLRRVERAVGRQ